MLTRLNRERHSVVETELARFLRRETGEERFFTLRHHRSDNWVVCRWVDKNNGWFVELQAIKNLGDFTREDAQHWLKWSRGKLPSGRELLKQLDREEQAEAIQQMEDDDEQRRRMKWLGRKLRDEGNPVWDQPYFPMTMQAQ